MSSPTTDLKLPEGYTLEQDGDGDWILVPPEDVTIFSQPGEGLLIGTCDYDTALSDALEWLGPAIDAAGGSNGE